MSKINIITTAVTPVHEVIRGGGEEQSLVTTVAKKITQSLEVSSEFISEQIFNTISVVNSAIDKLYDASKQFSADEITLSLAVSAEGNIGLVSAGAEATIEIKFKRVDKVSS